MPEAIREKAEAWPVVLKDCHTGLSTFLSPLSNAWGYSAKICTDVPCSVDR